MTDIIYISSYMNAFRVHKEAKSAVLAAQELAKEIPLSNGMAPILIISHDLWGGSSYPIASLEPGISELGTGSFWLYARCSNPDTHTWSRKLGGAYEFRQLDQDFWGEDWGVFIDRPRYWHEGTVEITSIGECLDLLKTRYEIEEARNFSVEEARFLASEIWWQDGLSPTIEVPDEPND